MRLKLVIGSVVLHVVVALVLWAQSVWKIDQLDRGRDRLADLAVLDMPAPPQGSPATPKPASEIPKKHVVHEPRQPTKRDVKPPDETPPGDGKDKIGTDEPITGHCENPPCGLDEQKKDEPKPEPKPEPPPVKVKKMKIVRPPDLEHIRIFGDTQVHPSEVDKMAMIRAGNPRTTAQFLLCIDERGAVASVKMQRSSGYPDYDARLSAAMHAWRYRPYMVDGEAQPACSTVTFDYRM